MKYSGKRAPSIRLPLRHAVALACVATLASLVGGQALAQVQDEVVDPVAAEAGPRSGMWVEPRVTTGITFSNNGNQSSTNPVSEQILEVAPGVTAVFNKPRAKGFIDYSLSGLYYAEGTSGDYLRNTLNANMTFEAVDNRVFLDVAGVMADETISAFGTQSLGRSDANRSETASFRVSPYVRGRFGSLADYELRYGVEQSNTDVGTRSDITVQDISLGLRSDMTGRSVGWLFDASLQDVDYSMGRRTRSNRVQAGLLYEVTPQLLTTVLAGVESNNVITLNRESYNNVGLNMDWRPSERTRLVAGVQKRYFGTGHNVALEHRTGRTVWRLIDSRDAVSNPLATSGTTLGTIYGLLDNLYASQEPDPVQRARLIQAELLRLGLPADAASFDNFLTSSATLTRSQALSVAFVGQRDVVTFTLARGDSRRLAPVGNLGDDFDLTERIEQQSWSVIYAHRLTPITTFTAGIARQTNEGSLLSGLDSRLMSVTLGMTTRVSLRTSASFQLLRSVYDRTGFPYGETAISAFITHRF